MDTRDNAELWRKAAMVLKEMRASSEKIDEMEKLVGQIKKELAETSGQEHSYNQSNLYDKSYLLAKLQTTLESLRRGFEELKGLEKSLQTLSQKVDLDEKIREQIREQLRRKMQIVFKEK